MADKALSPEEVVTRQKQRAGIILNVKKEVAKGNSAVNADPVDLKTLQMIAVKLREYQKRIHDYSNEIQNAMSGDAQDKDIQKMVDTDELIMDMLANLETTVDIRRDELRSGQTPVQKSSSSDVSHVSTTDSRIRLPKIELMTYNGDPLKWDEFWDYFNVTFHSNNDIPVIEKFTYLRSLMTGDALRLVEGYRLTAANYDEVIKALQERFGDPEIAIFQHFDAMLTLPVASGDVNDLQRVFDLCEAHIRSLIALGLSEDTFGRVFAPILLSKLPGNVRVELIRKKGRDAWSLAKLRELLRDELYARDMSKRSFGSSKPNDQRSSNGFVNKSSNMPNKRNSFTASALASAEKVKTTPKPVTCKFCGGAHYNSECSKYTTAEARRQRVRGSCYACLGNGHSARECKRKRPCYFCHNTGHNQSLCDKKFPSRNTGSKTDGTTQLNIGSTKADVTADKSVTSSIMSHGGQRGVLQTAIADVAATKGTASVRHMLDNGSDNSFITNKTAEKIGARLLGTENISLAGFSDSKRRQQAYKVYEFDIVLRDGRYLTIKAYGTDVIVCSIDKLAFDLQKYPVLARLPLSDPLADKNEHVQVDVLIGSDYYYDIVKTERIPLHDGLILLDSELGYIVAGRVNSGSTSAASLLLSRSPMPDSNFDIERFWKLEEIGVKEVNKSEDDETALAKFNRSVQFDEVEHRYYVKWPYKSDCSPLPSNYGLAFGRLKSMIARANSTNGLIGKCQEIFDSQVAKQIIEPAPETPDGPVHYLPHHAVITPDKATTKVRVVYDASSKSKRQQPSLNDCVLRGPVMLENLCGLLIRFRLRPIGITSDIEKAFLQVGLQKTDRDVTRFLWLKDTSKPCTANNLIQYRFTRVCFGVIASPFLLAATISYHLKRLGTPFADRILSNLYVDNIIDGDATTETALEYYKEAKWVFQQASMNLREWYSNDAKFMSAIPDADRGSCSKTKVLGLWWDLADDMLSCSASQPDNVDVVTKRYILHTIAKIFDPCGYFTPITSPAKWLMQELWQRKYDWDVPLDNDLVDQWKRVFANLQSVSEIKIPRHCGPFVGVQSVQLHVFCDASAKAYCAAVYLVSAAPRDVTSCLVFSKCRVSPVKKQSIPRLELLAATIGIRLLAFVSDQLRIAVDAKFLWSDSQCVLHWILGKPVSTVFVRNRIQEIKSYPNVEFRFVPTADNPADLPTRGLNIDHLQHSTLWWHGPSWLINSQIWPETPILANDSALGLNTNQPEAETTTLTTSGDDRREIPVDINRFATLRKLIRVTAWLQRFVQNCRIKTRQRHSMTLRSRSARSFVNENSSLAPALSVNELQRSKLFWERAVQEKHFRGTATGAAKLKSLGPITVNQDGIICCSNRLGNANLHESAKFPKLLPKEDRFTLLLIQDCHERLNHAGVKHTLAELRCEYWIIHGRAAVKRVITQCLLCRRQKGGPFGIPEAPDLPDFRVQESAPFATVGLDYLGPLMIYSSDGSNQKVWISLFTCAVTRAIHLEVVSQLDSENFLLCFRRFVSFFGCPKLIVSDNAGQFTSSRRVLAKLWQEAFQSPTVQEFSASREIGWKFITECAPWMGGFYERLVGVVKSSLKAVLDRRRLSLVELQTVVYEVATVVNSRPLIYSEDEIGDVAITPAHLIMRHRSIVPFESSGEPSDRPTSTQEKLIAGWKRLINLVDSFWSMWQKHYLLSLRERSRFDKQRNVVRTVPYAGQVVLIGDRNLQRSQWRIGRITEPIVSADNRIRSVKLRLPQGKVLSRPIKILYPVEISD